MKKLHIIGKGKNKISEMGSKMFKNIAMQFRKPTGFFGSIVARIMVKGNRPVYETLLKYMNVEEGDRLLEIGYGPGVGINLIMERYNPGGIYGVDFSELMCAKAAVRNKKHVESGKVKLTFGDFITAEVKEKDFDKIYFTNVVYFWSSLKEPFEKLHALVKNEGTVFFYMAGEEYLKKNKMSSTEIFNKYSIEKITAALKLAGFKDVQYFFEKGYYIKAIK